MEDPSHVAGVAQVIQAAVAPVFLLSGLLVSLVVAALLLFMREIFIATGPLTFGGTRRVSGDTAG